MALANLTINVDANTQAAQRGLQDVGATARDAMRQSSASVQEFQSKLTRSSADMQLAAKQMGSGMDAANDAIVAGSVRSEDAVNSLAESVKKFDVTGMIQKVPEAFDQSFAVGYAQAQTWMEKTKDYVVEKGKGIAIGMAIAAVSVTAAAVYGAYKIISGSLGFIKGLFTGDSYKSSNIDALIAANKEVLALQKSLTISAQEAVALNDALARKGVDKSDYIAAQDGAAKAMRTNGDELDRLGIKYKDVNGQLLASETFLTNVKNALDGYTDGYDRNAAAAAIGAGSYDQINSALQINQAELVKSKDRLDEYGLSIGPQSQAAVDAYVTAMREFDHESELTSQGFKRAVADNIMPVLTDLAEFFRDGFPMAVRVFRYTMAEVTSLFYGLKTVTYIVAESVLGLIESMGLAVVGLGGALVKVFQGDFAGAKDTMIAGWEDAKKRFADIGSNIVAQATHNRDAMALAWGMDDRTASIAESKQPKQGKAWVPAPAAATPTPQVKSPYAAYLDELDRTLKKVQDNEYAAMRLKAEQLAQKEGITNLTAAYQKINAIQRGESQKVVDDYTQKLKTETDQQKAQTDMMGMTALQQAKLTFAMQKNLELENLISQAKKSGKPLDDAAIKSLKDQTVATITLGQAELDRRNQIERSGQFGSDKAISDYMDAIGNDATKMGNRVTMVFQGMEDALVNFVKTGKLDFSSLADSVISDMIRMAVQQSIMQPLAQGYQTGGWSGMLSAGMSLLGFAGGGDPPVGVPSMVGENGPELFVPKAAGTIIPNSALSGSQSQAAPITVYQNFTVGDVASISTLRQAVANSERRIAAAIGRNAVYGSGAIA